MNTAELTIHLPTEGASFLEHYAQQHQTTVDQLVARYAKSLKSSAGYTPHPANLAFTGVVPADIDARETCRQHVLEKNQGRSRSI